MQCLVVGKPHAEWVPHPKDGFRNGTHPTCPSRVGIVWDEVKDYIRNKLP